MACRAIMGCVALCGALPRTPPEGSALWTPAKGRRPLEPDTCPVPGRGPSVWLQGPGRPPPRHWAKCPIAKAAPLLGVQGATPPDGVVGRSPAQDRTSPTRPISHCRRGEALLDGAAHYLALLDGPRWLGGAAVIEEGALAHGRTEEKDHTVAPGHASRASCAAEGDACRMRELWRAQAPAPRLQPLRLLRRARGRSRRQGAAGRCPRLSRGSGMGLIRP